MSQAPSGSYKLLSNRVPRYQTRSRSSKIKTVSGRYSQVQVAPEFKESENKDGELSNQTLSIGSSFDSSLESQRLGTISSVPSPISALKTSSLEDELNIIKKVLSDTTPYVSCIKSVIEPMLGKKYNKKDEAAIKENIAVLATLTQHLKEQEYESTLKSWINNPNTTHQYKAILEEKLSQISLTNSMSGAWIDSASPLILEDASNIGKILEDLKQVVPDLNISDYQAVESFLKSTDGNPFYLRFITESFKILKVNDAAIEFFKLDPNNPIQSFQEKLSPMFKESMEAFIDGIMRFIFILSDPEKVDKKWTQMLPAIVNGERKYIQISLNPIQNNLNRVTLALCDITQQVEENKRLRELIEKNNELNKQQDYLRGQMNHDLKNECAALIGCINDVREFLDKITFFMEAGKKSMRRRHSPREMSREEWKTVLESLEVISKSSGSYTISDLSEQIPEFYNILVQDAVSIKEIMTGLSDLYKDVITQRVDIDKSKEKEICQLLSNVLGGVKALYIQLSDIEVLKEEFKTNNKALLLFNNIAKLHLLISCKSKLKELLSSSRLLFTENGTNQSQHEDIQLNKAIRYYLLASIEEAYNSLNQLDISRGNLQSSALDTLSKINGDTLAPYDLKLTELEEALTVFANNTIRQYEKNWRDNKRLIFKLNPTQNPENIDSIYTTTEIYELFKNLISNALKYTAKAVENNDYNCDEGIVTLSLKIKTAPLGSIAHNSVTDSIVLSFKIHDNGLGIREDLKDKIFEENVTEESSEGSPGSVASRKTNFGLGLAHALSFVNAHLGTLYVASTSTDSKDHHTTFVGNVRFNRRLKSNEIVTKSDQLCASIPAIEANSRQIKFSSLKVGVVDDSFVIKRMIQKVLDKWHVFSGMGSSGNELARLVVDNRLDLVLVDNQMPGKNGSDAIYEIRQLSDEKRQIGERTFTLEEIEILKACKYMLLTGDNENDVKKRSSNREMYLDGFLSKPITEDQLKCSIVQMFAKNGVALVFDEV